jgi:hypothetical protein
MALNHQQIVNHMVGKTILSCELDYADNLIILELDDGSYIEVAGQELSIYAEIPELDD